MMQPSAVTRSDPCAAPGGSPGLLSFFTSLPGVSTAIHALTTLNIGPVTQLLDAAGYLPLLLSAEGRRVGDTFEVRSEPRRFEIAAEACGPGRLTGRNRVGGPAAVLRFRWRPVPEDYVGEPDSRQALPPLPLLPSASQRIEVFDWELRFHGGAAGYRAYGMGRTLPGGGLAFALDVLEGFGELAGLAGTVVASGAVTPDGALELAIVTRVMDPAGGPLTTVPSSPLPPGAGAGPGVTYVAFLGQVDPSHPVTLRLSLTEGILGSNVYEQLRVATLDFDTGAGGRLRGGARAGAVVGSVSARLSFDPLSLCALSPIQTRCGVFEFHDPASRSLGTLYSDMIEGRSFRTGLQGMLLPVFRFGGFGPIAGGTGEFAGARGIMTMNSVISVQPRTLANLYVLRLEDPDGRYRAALGGVA
ncbi:MAG: hypothetical protein ACJ76Y_29145 [Thermoanaerobaculia bacterium]